jgi:glycosyltransferase involved in cell wall biosynthesis
LLIGLCGFLIAKKVKAKLLTSVYGTNVFDVHWKKERAVNYLLAPLAKTIMRLADAIQTDGLATFRELQKRFGEKVFLKPIIPSNINDFKAEKILHEDFNILFVGRLVEQKNLPMLLNVIEKIKSPAKWTIIGNGKLKFWLEEEAKRRNLKNIILIPEVSRPEIIEYYQRADLLVLTSYFEGFAKVFMEAAAMGLPIITTQVSGADDVIEDGKSGFIVEQNDVDKMAERIDLLYKNSHDCELFSQRIKDNFWNKFSENSTMEVQKRIFGYLKNGDKALNQ